MSLARIFLLTPCNYATKEILLRMRFTLVDVSINCCETRSVIDGYRLASLRFYQSDRKCYYFILHNKNDLRVATVVVLHNKPQSLFDGGFV